MTITGIGHFGESLTYVCGGIFKRLQVRQTEIKGNLLA